MSLLYCFRKSSNETSGLLVWASDCAIFCTKWRVAWEILASGCFSTYSAPSIFLLRAHSLAISAFVTVGLLVLCVLFTRPNTASDDVVSAWVKALYSRLTTHRLSK